MEKIGFIGAGIMGKPMIRNLMKAGFEVSVYARDKSKINDLLVSGAVYHSTIKSCVEDCNTVITMVGFPRDVEEIYFEEGNILDSVKEGTYLIDMTTTSPKISEKIYEEGTKKGLHILDAPVTGGDQGAINGTLSILVGGEKEDYEHCLPIFQALGTTINYQGKTGSGQHCKMMNQIMIAGTLSGICEAVSYAKAKGLDVQNAFHSVAAGAAGSKQLDLLGAKIIDGDYTPGFFIKHFVKDMKIALIESNMSDLNLEMLSMVLAHFEELESEGCGDLGTQALIKYYEVEQESQLEE